MRAPELLKNWRKAAGLSQGEAAKQLDVRQPTWSDYEQGNKVPRTILAVKIAAMTSGAVPVESWGASEETPIANAPESEKAAS